MTLYLVPLMDFSSWKDKVNSVTQYDGWETLETMHSVNIHDQSYRLLNVGGLSQTRLIPALVWPQPYTVCIFQTLKYVFSELNCDVTNICLAYKPGYDTRLTFLLLLK